MRAVVRGRVSFSRIRKDTVMSEVMKNRREFLATVGAAGAAAILAGSGEIRGNLAPEGTPRLAVDGGTPVRKRPLSSRPYGPEFYDDVERKELLDVLASKSPFRWRGPESK